MPSNIPSAVQHAFLVLVTALLVWGGQALPSLNSVPGGVKDVIAAVIGWLVGYALPALSDYGFGLKAPAAEVASAEGA